MAELAEQIGVSRATLYRWVGSKERLLGEVIFSLAEESFELALADARGSGPAYIADAIERYMRAAIDFPPLRRFVAANPEYALRVLASKHSPMQRRSIAATRALLAAQAETGAFDPPLDLDTLAYVIVRIVESFLFNDVITGGEPDVRGAADAIDALLRAPPRTLRRRAGRSG
jgi:AcrR family transcriptional regulator